MHKLLFAVGLTVAGIGGGTVPAGASTAAVVELSGTWTEDSWGGSLDLSGTATGVNGLSVWVREATACGGSFSWPLLSPLGGVGTGGFGCGLAGLAPYSAYLVARSGTVLQLRPGPPQPGELFAFGVSLECVLVPNQLPPAAITSYAATCAGVAARP